MHLHEQARTGSDSLPQQSVFSARDTVEAIVISALREILDVEDLAWSDDPFDHGLDSIGLLRLTATLHDALGVDVTMAELAGSSTVEGMARLARQSSGARGSVLVRVRSEASDRPPLFWVHDVGGDVAPIWRTTGELRRDVYGTRAVGLEGEAPVPVSMEGMAKPLAGAIAETAGSVPVYVVGFSSGGVLAYEVARQLVARRRHVGLLAIVDSATGPPLQKLRNLNEAIAFRLAWVWQRLHEENYTGDVPPGMVERAERVMREANLDAAGVMQDLKMHGYFPADAPVEALSRRVEVFARTNEAWRAYRPGRLDIPIIFLRSDDADPGIEDEWRLRSGSSRFEVQDVGGHHDHSMYTNRCLLDAIRMRLQMADEERR